MVRAPPIHGGERADGHAAEAWLRERGARDLELTVFEVNADAFHEALGYRLLSRHMVRTL